MGEDFHYSVVQHPRLGPRIRFVFPSRFQIHRTVNAFLDPSPLSDSDWLCLPDSTDTDKMFNAIYDGGGHGYRYMNREMRTSYQRHILDAVETTEFYFPSTNPIVIMFFRKLDKALGTRMWIRGEKTTSTTAAPLEHDDTRKPCVGTINYCLAAYRADAKRN